MEEDLKAIQEEGILAGDLHMTEGMGVILRRLRLFALPVVRNARFLSGRLQTSPFIVISVFQEKTKVVLIGILTGILM